MPIRKRWSKFTKQLIDSVPTKDGIYELADVKDEIVYIGSSDKGEDIRGRLRFHKKNKSRTIKSFRFILASFLQSAIAMEQQHCELFKAKHGGKLPRLQKKMPRGYLLHW